MLSLTIIGFQRIIPKLMALQRRWFMSQPHFDESVRMRLTLPEWGLGSLSGLLKLQSSIAGVKTPRIGKLLKCRCQKWVCTSNLDICNTSYGKKKGRESNWQFDPWPLKVGNRPDPGACRWSATHCWKVLDESYKFTWNLISIRSLSKKLWPCKVAGVQTRTISGLLLGSLGIKSHLDAGAVERRREYYMGEGGDFPWVWAVVSLMSLKLPVACSSTKGAPETELTNLLVGLMQVRISE
jgi:hypothetical protein